MHRLALLLVLFVAACDIAPTAPGATDVPPSVGSVPGPQQAARNFAEVVRRVEPVAERECRERTSGVNCDFRIAIDPDTHAAPNAFQTLDRNGRPVLIFTVAMVATVRNADELAFVMAHEASHHIAGHLIRQARDSAAGAAIMAGLATMAGASPADISAAQDLGAIVGARSYSKEYELEADMLGTVIAARAGYDPRIGALYFTRIPDPGDQFLGTHPPNAVRMETVLRTAAMIGL